MLRKENCVIQKQWLTNLMFFHSNFNKMQEYKHELQMKSLHIYTNTRSICTFKKTIKKNLVNVTGCEFSIDSFCSLHKLILASILIKLATKIPSFSKWDIQHVVIN